MSPENEKALAAAEAVLGNRHAALTEKWLAASVRRLVARVEELEAGLTEVLELEPRETDLRYRPVRCQLTAAENSPPCHCYSCASIRWHEAKKRAAALLARKEGSR